MNFENEPKLGIGIYTASEIAQILRVPYGKVYTWMHRYWDGKLGAKYEEKYSWQMDGTRAVSFHTFIEFYVMMRFSESGVKPQQVLQAHSELSQMYDTAFPFAKKEVLDSISTDGKNIFFDIDGVNLTLNGTKQFNLDIIRIFFVNLDFGDNDLASRYWPLGKEKRILIDPKRKFGHPVLVKQNIYPETLYNHYIAGDPIPYLSHIYQVSEQEVKDAIEYCTKDAA
ncbi:DUF433 domain-containing protein [Xanthomarina gelatinilytica]|uniref:DUF433 domain-containing protein n=1 Tax=Xanthomarina gelatinilytica TaxID=1137281 RepID=UPI003AA91337